MDEIQKHKKDSKTKNFAIIVLVIISIIIRFI